jgi:hypothetical protein
MRKKVRQAPTAGEQKQQKVSDIFRHGSGTGKSYCRMRFDVESGKFMLRTNHVCQILMKLEFSSQIFEKYSKYFMQTCLVRSELFHVDRQMDRHDEAYSRFLFPTRRESPNTTKIRNKKIKSH